MIRFSLIVATVGRTVELRRLLESLDRQNHRDFEVIVVDQNLDDRLAPILGAFEKRFDIHRVISAPGLSRARNAGLGKITGNVLSFPDDDCWYHDDVLARVNEVLAANPEWDAVIGEAVDQFGRRILPWQDKSGRLTKATSWRRSLAYAYFVRSHVIHRIGGFDETLGVGSKGFWQSGEDNDLMLRALEAGFHVRFDANICINHPRIFASFDEASRAKRYRYSLGDGRLLRKHPMPLWWVMLLYAVPAGRAIAALLQLKFQETQFHWATLVGRYRGFIWSKVGDDHSDWSGKLPPPC